MTDDLAAHWKLHEIDERAGTAESARSRLPAERLALGKRITTERAKLAALEHEAQAAQQRRRALERDAESLLVEERHFRRQLEAVTDQKQYDAVQHEIAAVHERRSELETRALEQMELEEACEAKRPERTAALAKAETDGAQSLERLAAEDARLAAELAVLEARRAEVAAALDPAARARYERLRTGRAGQAVAAITNGACGACFRTLSPSGVQAARKHEQLLVCDGCGRLLLLSPLGGTA